MFNLTFNTESGYWCISCAGIVLCEYREVNPPTDTLREYTLMGDFLKSRGWGVTVHNSERVTITSPDSKYNYYDPYSRTLYPESIYCRNLGSLRSAFEKRAKRPPVGYFWESDTGHIYKLGQWTAWKTNESWTYRVTGDRIQLVFHDLTQEEWLEANLFISNTFNEETT